ncbi:hypothetical protein BN971_04548 [Mycobacterium terramassiliense]|uniref:DUF732 domain-containing protein n=2 Tax=Mycobacterium terramassiliense TaxID=1841859 RepID=A0A2U3N9P2_9MYCO|nr:hypothetical protein BN971_04548 [Mycobacterium terramassiliense]
MAVMAEPSPAGDETFALNRAETVAVPNDATADAADRTSPRAYDDDVGGEPASDRQSWSATWRKAGALLAAGLALAGAIIFAFWLLNPDPKGTQPAAPKGAAPAPATPSASAAPPSIASTPDQDNKYVQNLNNHGISFANPEAAISNGKMVCNDIGRGVSVPQIVNAFHASNPGLDAETYVSISVHAYCPQNANLVGGGP